MNWLWRLVADLILPDHALWLYPKRHREIVAWGDDWTIYGWQRRAAA